MSNPTQPIMAKLCNSIIQTILLIIIISYTILCKVISFKNCTHKHCELFTTQFNIHMVGYLATQSNMLHTLLFLKLKRNLKSHFQFIKTATRNLGLGDFFFVTFSSLPLKEVHCSIFP